MRATSEMHGTNGIRSRPTGAATAYAVRRRHSELLRIATAGSVDDGKSTLIGRLLYDTKPILDDQLEHVEETSERRGDGYVNLALLTDGLRAEREQGITIDVAYRYFATPRRKFIIADAPGHVQYTRNMVTGASTADVSIVLVDARKGVSSRRGATPTSPRCCASRISWSCVNKMDLVDYDEDVFDEILEELHRLVGAPPGPRHHLHPDLGAARRQRRRPLRRDAVVRRRAAALPPRARRDRAGPQPQRRPLPGAVGDPPDVRRAPRLPRLRAARSPAACCARRRGRRPARRPAHRRSRRSTPSTASSRRRSRRCR